MIDTVPTKPRPRERIIVNLDSSHNPGTHWVAIRKEGNYAFYFDSFGNLKPPKEIDSYLSDVHILYNKHRYQDFDTVICGHLCLQFLL